MSTPFNNTKYTRWYWQIIAKRAITNKKIKGEVHHIIPRSLGGSDEPHNLVKLSGHDHAWCHWLLTKMTSSHERALMVYAFNMMGVYGDHMERKKSYAIVRAYERNREEWSRIHSEYMTGREAWNKGRKEDRPDVLARIREAANERKVDPERMAEGQAKRVAKVTGQKRSAETKQRMHEAHVGKKKGAMREEHKKALSDALTGHKKSQEFAEKCADRMREEFKKNNPNTRPELQKNCTHCGLTFGPTNYKRWHGDNCKMRQK